MKWSERARKPVVRYGIDDYADIVYKAYEIDEAGGGELIKCWASVQEKINQEATISFKTRVREADGTTWSDVTTHRGGVL